MCYGPTCITIRRFFNVIGAGLGVVNSAFDFVYVVKSPYYSKMSFVVSILAIIIRMVFNFAICQYFFTKQVINYKPRLGAMTEDKYGEEGNASEQPDEKN